MVKLFTTKKLCRAGIIAGLYIVLAFAFQPISFGGLQLRVAESLCVLPFFYGESVIALFIGCMVSNVLGYGIYDVVFGSLATLLSASITYAIGRLIKNKYLKYVVGVLPDIVINAFMVPLILFLSGVTTTGYWVSVGFVALGELTVFATFGVVVYYSVSKIFKKTENTLL